MTRLLGPVALLLVVALVGLPARGASAQLAAEQTVENGYPRTLTFDLEATTDATVAQVALRYSVFGGTGAIEQIDGFDPTTSVSASVTVDVDQSGAFIPVGSTFTYHWELTAASGEVLETNEQQFVYLPPGQDWEQLANDFLVVYYHGDRSGLAQDYLDAATLTYDTIGRDLLQTELRRTPVSLVLFADERELDPARPGEVSSFDASVLTCGVKLNDVVLFAIPQSCGSGDRTDTLRHEFAHILNETAGEGPLGILPAWLDEGTAVMAQSEPGDGYTGPLDLAIRSDRLIPFNQMGTPATNPAQVGLFYGQAWAMSKFLADEDPDRFAELFATIRDGTRFDRALESVYGYDLAGFEDRFRAANGLDPRVVPTAAPTQPPGREDPPEPTAPAADGQVAPGDGDDGPDALLIGLIALPVLFALLALLAWLLLLIQTRNREQQSAASNERDPWNTNP